MTTTTLRRDIECPPSATAKCVCGDELQDHFGTGDLCFAWITSGRPRTFVPTDADQQVCSEVTSCEECGALICSEHSDEFTTCLDSPHRLHHLDCRESCAPCMRALADDRGL